ncbi:MAG: tetratricopeptide repeat protein, partial [Myxococcota bacterium]
GRYAEAMPWVERAVDLFRGARDYNAYAPVLIELGLVLGELGRIDEAIVRFEQGLRFTAVDVNARTRHAVARILREHWVRGVRSATDLAAATDARSERVTDALGLYFRQLEAQLRTAAGDLDGALRAIGPFRRG